MCVMAVVKIGLYLLSSVIYTRSVSGATSPQIPTFGFLYAWNTTLGGLATARLCRNWFVKGKGPDLEWLVR